MAWKAKTKMEQKVEFIHEWLTQKYTITELCRSFDISRPTAYKLISRYEKMGLSGLIDQERAPLNHPNRTDPKVENSILKFKNKSKKTVLSRFLLLIPVLFLLISFQNKKSDFMNKTLANPMLAMDLPEVPLNGTIVQPNDTTLVDDKIFKAVEIALLPRGGMASFLKGIAKDYRVPQAIVAAQTTGRIITTFVVERNGTLSDIKVVKDLGSGTAEEAIRVLKNSPRWSLGISSGRPVRVQYMLPIVLATSTM